MTRVLPSSLYQRPSQNGSHVMNSANQSGQKQKIYNSTAHSSGDDNSREAYDSRALARSIKFFRDNLGAILGSLAVMVIPSAFMLNMYGGNVRTKVGRFGWQKDKQLDENQNIESGSRFSFGRFWNNLRLPKVTFGRRKELTT
jgi:hypothetical protein